MIMPVDIVTGLTTLQWMEIICFVVGYFAIIFEHSLGIHKTTSALLMAVVLWSLQFCDGTPLPGNLDHLSAHLSNICQVILFLLGALTIVEQMHVHGGLSIVGRCLRVSSGVYTLVLVSGITFFMAALLGNLTTTIVMLMLLKKSIEERELRWIFGGIIVIAANAGGVWAPIGDVTTTMLWIGGQLSSSGIVTTLFLPSLTCLIVSAFCMSRYVPAQIPHIKEIDTVAPKARTVLYCGTFALLFVPIFKYLTGLPPFMGMLFAMSMMWLVTDLLHSKHKDREYLRVVNIFPKIDMSGILFFLGILLAVSALEESGILMVWANALDDIFSSKIMIAYCIGLVSAVIDNVPLVAATMGMYDLHTYPMDDQLWSLIAYCAGAGGSVLVIGSAAGIAFMGLERVDFFWYAKKIGPAAFLGYSSGVIIWVMQNIIFIQ